MPVKGYYTYGPYGYQYVSPHHIYYYPYSTFIPFNYGYVNPALPSDYADLLEVALATHLSNLPAVLGHRGFAY